MDAFDANITNFWVQFAAGTILVIGAAIGFVRWLLHRAARIKARRASTKIAHESGATALAEVEEVKTTLKEMSLALARVEGQFKNNGGASHRDQMDRIERYVVHTDEKLDAVKAELDRHLGYHDAMEEIRP